MCEIINTHKIGNDTIIDCSPYNGNFIGASILKIIDKSNKVFQTRDFIVEKTRPCFSGGGTPWIMTKAAIPENFLNKGNEIVLQ